jgi:hypothetical protein
VYVTVRALETDAMSPKFLLVREVLAAVARSGSPEITRTAEVDEAFGGLDAFLLALHHRWSTAVFAHLDALIEDEPDDLDHAVRMLWTDPATGGRGLRAVLDAYADHPALAAAYERDRRRVGRDLGVELPPAGAGGPATRRRRETPAA